MAALSDYLENALINHIFRNTDFNRPATIYVALFTSDPGDDGSGTEVSGNDYVRMGVDTGAGSEWDAASGGATANTGEVAFPEASGSWGTITHVGLYDAETNGNLLFHGALAVNKPIGSGDIFRFNAGDLDVSLT